MRKPFMILGCTSGAGKSFLVAALCRHFSNRGLREGLDRGRREEEVGQDVRCT